MNPLLPSPSKAVTKEEKSRSKADIGQVHYTQSWSKEVQNKGARQQRTALDVLPAPPSFREIAASTLGETMQRNSGVDTTACTRQSNFRDNTIVKQLSPTQIDLQIAVGVSPVISDPSTSSKLDFSSLMKDMDSIESEDSESGNVEACNNLCCSLCTLYCLCWVTPLSLFAVTASALSCILLYTGHNTGARIFGTFAFILSIIAVIAGITLVLLHLVSYYDAGLVGDSPSNQTIANLSNITRPV